MPRLTRRAFVATGIATGLFARFPAIGQTSGLSHGMFTHAVASGDPLQTAIILWTRFVTADARDGTIGWEIAEDETFNTVVTKGQAPVSVARDFCVKVDAQGLKPGRPYAYRFISADGPSVAGLTRTLPEAGVATLGFALFSCSNLPFGRFHAYQDAATRADVDLCIHVGDYLYEYSRGHYPTTKETAVGRVLEPETELVSPSDYHRRYACYRDDADLQELHRVKPWITVWDDHELANDSWMGGAQNHNPVTQGDWADRKVTAVQAYCDWLPIRHDPSSGLSIYRRFDWGDLATIIALDTRLIGRVQQFTWNGVLKDVLDKDDATIAAAAEAFGKGPLQDSARTLMGPAQEAWLSGELKRSKGMNVPWQVLAQQIVVGQTLMPDNALSFATPETGDSEKKYIEQAAQLGKLGLPYDLDDWDGYPAARTRLLADLQANANNAVILSGDSHNAWANSLKGPNGQLAAVEVGGTSVTSPGMEKSLGGAGPGAREAAFRSVNPELTWADTTNKGYCIVNLTRTECRTRFVATGAPSDVNAKLVSETVLTSEAGASGPSAWQVS